MELTLANLSKVYVRKEHRMSIKTFGRPEITKKAALCDVSFTLSEGLYGLLGPNGAGKSTLMKITAGILRPDEGTVLWNGQEISSLGKKYRSILGFMPQQQGLYSGFTGKRFLDYMCALKEIPSAQTKKEIRRVAEIVHLLPELNKRLENYSGGMKQRILLASALLGVPQKEDAPAVRGDAPAGGHRPGPHWGGHPHHRRRAHGGAGPKGAGKPASAA